MSEEEKAKIRPKQHKIQLVSVSLESFSGKRFLANDLGETAGFQTASSADAGLYDDKESAWFSIDVDTTAAPEGEDADENRIFEISLVVRGEFRAAAESSEEEIMSFVTSQGQFLLWPYAREAIASFSQRLGLPALVMPTIDVVKTLEAIQEQVGTEDEAVEVSEESEVNK